MTRVLGSLVLVVGLSVSLAAQQGAADGEWRSYAGDTGSTKYSPLDQITAANVQDLRVAWRWRSIDYELRDADPERRFNDTFLVTPLMVDGRLFVSTNLGQAAAIDAATGETVWSYHALEDGAGLPSGGGTRGVGYWSDDARSDRRVFVVSGEHLVALDAGSGRPIREFGEGGKVNLRAGVPRLEEYRWTAAPPLARHGDSRDACGRPADAQGSASGVRARV